MDPVETYLNQIADIPLLTRDQELAVAERVEQSRERYRSAVLSLWPVIETAAILLDEAERGRRSLYDLVDVSLSDSARRRLIHRQLATHLGTMRGMLDKNRADIESLLRANRSARSRRRVWRRIAARRRRAVRLIEEVRPRMDHFQAVLGRPSRVSERMDRLEAALRGQPWPSDSASVVRGELKRVMRAPGEPP